jgi:hypothetical protein
MTFLNTMSNFGIFLSLILRDFSSRINFKNFLGSNWPVTVAFYLANTLTIKKCAYDTGLLKSHNSNKTISEMLNTIDRNSCTNDRETTVSMQRGLIICRFLSKICSIAQRSVQVTVLTVRQCLTLIILNLLCVLESGSCGCGGNGIQLSSWSGCQKQCGKYQTFLLKIF